MSMDEPLERGIVEDARQSPRTVISVTNTAPANRANPPHVAGTQPPLPYTSPAQSPISEASLFLSEQQAQQEQQQPPQQEASRSPNPRFTGSATNTRLGLQSTGRLPATSHRPEASVPAAATVNQATQTAFQATAATVRPTLSGQLLPPRPAPYLHPETNSTTPLGSSTAAPWLQQPTRPAAVPSQAPAYQPTNNSLNIPSAMAQAIYCAPSPYWHCYPGPTAGSYTNWNQPSPWYSGTAHYLTSPPLQVYTVEPAYIMPQATYYQAALQQGAGAVFYYVPGAPGYYYT